MIEKRIYNLDWLLFSGDFFNYVDAVRDNLCYEIEDLGENLEGYRFYLEYDEEDDSLVYKAFKEVE
jgi:hypothetical protein